MASWIITKDHTETPTSLDNLAGQVFWTTDGHASMYKDAKFRLFDDDKNLYYEGFAYLDDDNDTGFEPLDWAIAYAGCTRIDYWNESKRIWETL